MLSFWFAVIYMALYSVTFASLTFLYCKRMMKRMLKGRIVGVVCPNCKGLGKVNLLVSQVWVDCTMCNGKKWIERFIP